MGQEQGLSDKGSPSAATLKKYGLTGRAWTKMLVRQGFRCPICEHGFVLSNGRWTAQGESRSVCVDHCHVTGMVRGILCGKCNIMLGVATETKRTLFMAVTYLGAAARKIAAKESGRAKASTESPNPRNGNT